MFNNKNILITGGTGSFGKEFVKTIFKKYKKIKRLVIFSRDEFKQSEMSEEFPKKKYPAIRFFIGDVRDRDRLIRACKSIDYIIHAAALKQVPIAEYNPMEFIKTNIIGASNLIEASIATKVKKVVALSTDKAASPINLYGATKLCSDKLFIAANNYAGTTKISFSVVRYGNVMNSTGSLIPLIWSAINNKITLTLYEERMTRFMIDVEEAINIIETSLELRNVNVIPNLKSFLVKDIFDIYEK